MQKKNNKCHSTTTGDQLVKIMRLDHWFKNILILPGVLLAYLFGAQSLAFWPATLVLAVLAICLAASSNYVINEWLDRKFDKFHPVKKNRVVITSSLSSCRVYLLYTVLAASGLSLALVVSSELFFVMLSFLVMGIVYNVPPVRAKEIPFVDVVVESINNPLRLLVGWFAVTSDPFSALTVLFAYWLFGAFLMTLKRFAEYRKIGCSKLAGLYRKSFQHYSENKLLFSALLYVLLSLTLLALFFYEYSIKYALSLPLFVVAYYNYFVIAKRDDSPIQYPEKLYREKGLWGSSVALTGTLFLLKHLNLTLTSF